MYKDIKVANYSFILNNSHIKHIEIICNHLDVKVQNSPKKCLKYKKVGKNTKDLLIQMVNSGSSIVTVLIY
jgi:hypothetical protein